jgi:hypothetical protein
VRSPLSPALADVRGEWSRPEGFDRFRAGAPARFFAGPVDALTPSVFARLHPEARDRVVAAAEGVCLGRFDLLGYRGLSFGDPIDWHLDPVSGRRSSLVHWSRIDPTDADAVGDCKVVWELSRHQFLVTLGIAYRTTGDERYAAAFAGLVDSWTRANPVGMGLNWTSSLEVALRSIAWGWALFLFAKSPHLTPERFAALLGGIATHASHVERYLSRYFSPNTHLTGEALGLLYAGVVCSDHAPASAARWRALGQAVLEEQVHAQVLPDGVYFEQATTYQRYTVEIYLHYRMLAARNGLPVSAAVEERVQKMLDVLLALRRPDGGLPAIGDGDGGFLLPLIPRPPGDLRGVFALAGALFDRADYRWAAGGAQPEVLWLLGPSVVPNAAPAPPALTSRVFDAGGYVVLRGDAHHLVFDTGPLGCPQSGGHGHADLLSVQVSAFGDPYVVDPGTYVYSADPAARDYFRSTRAHATVTVDGHGQADPAGPFAWRTRPRARLRRFLSTPAFDLADAEHRAYERLRDPVRHRRQVVFVKAPGCWLVVDDLTGAAEHDVELRFPFAPMPVAVETTGDGASWVRATGPRDHALLLRAFAATPLDIRVEEGATSPLEGWVSSDYGRREPAPVLIYSARARLPLRVVTLLFPVDAATEPAPAVHPLLDAAGVPNGLRFDDHHATAHFRSGSFTIERSRTCTP